MMTTAQKTERETAHGPANGPASAMLEEEEYRPEKRGMGSAAVLAMDEAGVHHVDACNRVACPGIARQHTRINAAASILSAGRLGPGRVLLSSLPVHPCQHVLVRSRVPAAHPATAATAHTQAKRKWDAKQAEQRKHNKRVCERRHWQSPPNYASGRRVACASGQSSHDELLCGRAGVRPLAGETAAQGG